MCRGQCIQERGTKDKLCQECRHYCHPETRKVLIAEAATIVDAWEGKFDKDVTKEKVLVNNHIVKLLQPLIKSGQETTTGLFTLDGADFYTSKTWHQLLQVPAENIFVPAPFQSSHEKTLTLNADIKNLVIRKMFAYDLIDRIANVNDETIVNRLPRPEIKLTGVFLDYCATFSGNKHTVPRLDIDLLFKRHLFRCNNDRDHSQEALLVITFCAREEVSEGNLGKCDRFSEVLRVVGDIADNHGYYTRPAMMHTYKGAMYVCGVFVGEKTSDNKEPSKDGKEVQDESWVDRLMESTFLPTREEQKTTSSKEKEIEKESKLSTQATSNNKKRSFESEEIDGDPKRNKSSSSLPPSFCPYPSSYILTPDNLKYIHPSSHDEEHILLFNTALKDGAVFQTMEIRSRCGVFTWNIQKENYILSRKENEQLISTMSSPVVCGNCCYVASGPEVFNHHKRSNHKGRIMRFIIIKN